MATPFGRIGFQTDVTGTGEDAESFLHLPGEGFTADSLAL
jgi:hypothetical protein